MGREWTALNNHVAWAKGGPIVTWDSGGHKNIQTYKPVMLVGQGTPPVATIAGTGLDSVLTVAGRKVRFDAKANRVRAE